MDTYARYVAWIAAALVVVFGFWYFSGTRQSSANLDEFAQCLTDKSVTMYGADWCPHCQNEKKEFGSSFRFVQYVECPADPKRCIDAGVTGYPTWILPDGRKLLGEQGVAKLSQESGCQLPMK